MTEFRVDPQSPVVIDVWAKSPVVFRFTAQYRIPGRDYVNFASAKESTHVGQGVYQIVLPAPIASHTDLRIYFLVDGPANHDYRIALQCSQQGNSLGERIICEGMIGDEGKIVFATAEATFI